MTATDFKPRQNGSSKLHRGLGVALWRQIADDIRRGVNEGLADPSGRLPAEAELAARFGVNRHTVRSAIAALTHEGVLRSEQGRGTYVQRTKRLNYPIRARTRFRAGLEGQARDRSTELLSEGRERAGASVAAALTLEAGYDVIRLETLGLADAVPVLRATSWFDAARFPQIAEAYTRSGSVTQAFRDYGIDDYVRAWTRIEARHADQADTRDLKLSPGAIVLATTAVNVDQDGSPIQYSITRFAADRVELTIDNGEAGA